MQYRIDRLNNIYIRLNDDGSTLMIKIENNANYPRYTRVLSWIDSDWDMIYNNYSHSNKREFDEAEKQAKI